MEISKNVKSDDNLAQHKCDIPSYILMHKRRACSVRSDGY